MAAHHARNIALRHVPRNFYSAQAAVQQQASFELPVKAPHIFTTPDGLNVASFENNSPFAHLILLVKAGPRYESYENAGVSHLVRSCFGLKSLKHSTFLFHRQLEHWGAKVSAFGDKEHIRYSLSLPRENVDDALELLMEAALRPCFRFYEVRERFKHIALDRQLASPEFLTMELLHKAAFRNTGLGNSLFYPKYKLDKMQTNYLWYGLDYAPGYHYENTDQLVEFHKKTHTAPNMTLINVGGDYDKMLDYVTSFEMNISEAPTASPAPYSAGELREENGDKTAHVAIACPGASTGSKDAVPLIVVQHILGSPLGDELPCGKSQTKLGAAVSAGGGQAKTFAFSKNYSDGGLFGVYLKADAEKAAESVKAAVKFVRTYKITDADLETGKRRAKISLGARNISGCNEVRSLFSNYNFNLAEVESNVDKVTLQEAQNALATVLKGKITMASYGGIHKVPYIEEL